MSRRGSPRGASTTEFALALLLIVPCVLYGIEAAEVFMVGAKAQEAEIAAAWDVTAYRFHDYQSTSTGAISATVRGRYDAIGAAVSADIDTDLADLNSYAGSARRGVSLVAGKAEFIGKAVTCTRRDLKNGSAGGSYLDSAKLMPFDTFDYSNDPNFPTRTPGQAKALRDTLNRDHLLTCASRLQHTSLWVPTRFATEFTKNQKLNPMTAPTVFGGLGSSLNGLKAGTAPSLGMPMLVDDWAVEEENKVSGTEIALKDTQSANPKMYRAGERVHQMHTAYIGDEQLNEDFTFLLGHRWLFGETVDDNQLDAFRLGLDTAYSRKTNLQLESPLDPNDGNQPWYLLPHDDAEKTLPALDTVAATRVGRHYLGHPNASFNRP